MRHTHDVVYNSWSSLVNAGHFHNCETFLAHEFRHIQYMTHSKIQKILLALSLTLMECTLPSRTVFTICTHPQYIHFHFQRLMVHTHMYTYSSLIHYFPLVESFRFFAQAGSLLLEFNSVVSCNLLVCSSSQWLLSGFLFLLYPLLFHGMALVVGSSVYTFCTNLLEYKGWTS